MMKLILGFFDRFRNIPANHRIFCGYYHNSDGKSTKINSIYHQKIQKSNIFARQPAKLYVLSPRFGLSRHKSLE